jgi:hypothetical protein
LGCTRCKTLSIPCVYSSPRKGKRPQQIKSPVIQMREADRDTVQPQAQSRANSSLDSMPATAASHTQAQTTMLNQQTIIQKPTGGNGHASEPSIFDSFFSRQSSKNDTERNGDDSDASWLNMTSFEWHPDEDNTNKEPATNGSLYNVSPALGSPNNDLASERGRKFLPSGYFHY